QVLSAMLVRIARMAERIIEVTRRCFEAEPREQCAAGVVDRVGHGNLERAGCYPTMAVADLIACPFCRELFARGEARVCPACGLTLTDISKLPLSHDALAEDFGLPTPPHLETLPWFEVRRGRGFLVAAAVLGFVAFFAPWVNM